MRFAVTVVSPPGYVHAAAFNEVAETLHYGLQSLGHDSVLSMKGNLPGRRHIILGSNILPFRPMAIATDAILYNLEQVDAGSDWMRPELMDLFRRHTLWDYSETNAAKLCALGIPVAKVVPVGYTRELTRIEHAREPDIDVLFVGSKNPRRQQVLEAMREAGLRVAFFFGVYGEKRDALIARAKLMLNMHFYDAKVLEVVRISYLLANRCAVLSERSADKHEDEAFAEGVAFADYDCLAERARELIDTPEECARLAQCGFEIMQARPITEYLRSALMYEQAA
jgi:hypothetical protein